MSLSWHDINPVTMPAEQLLDMVTAHMVLQIKNEQPDLAAAIDAKSVDQVRAWQMKMVMFSSKLKWEELKEENEMRNNPDDPEVQKKIAERIRQKNVDEQHRLAMEETPEAFASVVMLYVDMEVNGIPFKAFVDSGAQITVMSENMARRCGIHHLIDVRYSSKISGVGTSTSVGKVRVCRAAAAPVVPPLVRPAAATAPHPSARPSPPPPP